MFFLQWQGWCRFPSPSSFVWIAHGMNLQQQTFRCSLQHYIHVKLYRHFPAEGEQALIFFCKPQSQFFNLAVWFHRTQCHFVADLNGTVDRFPAGWLQVLNDRRHVVPSVYSTWKFTAGPFEDVWTAHDSWCIEKGTMAHFSLVQRIFVPDSLRCGGRDRERWKRSIWWHLKRSVLGMFHAAEWLMIIIDKWNNYCRKAVL